jgi:Ca2+-binding EF-hand superfamily protein
MSLIYMLNVYISFLFRAFDRYDVDRDGYITVDDLRIAFREQGRQFSERDLDTWVRSRSPGGSGAVSFADFKRHYSQLTTKAA